MFWHGMASLDTSPPNAFCLAFRLSSLSSLSLSLSLYLSLGPSVSLGRVYPGGRIERPLPGFILSYLIETSEAENNAALRFKGAMERFAISGCDLKRSNPFFFGRISGNLAPSTRKSLAIAIVQFWLVR